MTTTTNPIFPVGSLIRTRVQKSRNSVEVVVTAVTMNDKRTSEENTKTASVGKGKQQRQASTLLKSIALERELFVSFPPMQCIYLFKSPY